MQQIRALKNGTGRAFHKNPAVKRILQCKYVYLLIFPGILYFLIFRYAPMFGVIIAFKDYRPSMGIMGFFTAEWVGFRNFEVLFKSIYFKDIITNTIVISLYKIIFGFPAPILLALLLNEVKSRLYKRTLQTVTYLPHFISWVVVAGMMFELLSPTSGSVNLIIRDLFGKPVNFFTDTGIFRGVLVVSDIWKEVGWGSIIYLAALAGVDIEQYEAAIIDGANRLQQLVYVTLPGIMPTVAVMFILRLGNILDAGFDQIFMLYSAQVYKVADIIDTFVYREGMVNARYGFATAVGLFKSAIGIILILSSNRLVKKFGHKGII